MKFRLTQEKQKKKTDKKRRGKEDISLPLIKKLSTYIFFDITIFRYVMRDTTQKFKKQIKVKNENISNNQRSKAV